MFIDFEMIKQCTEQSNIYAMQKDGKECAIQNDEIEKFFAILLYMGLFPAPSYRMYWENSSRFNPIAETMARNRFEIILHYLHFNDNSKLPGRNHPDYDPLFKIQPLLSSMRKNMLKVDSEERNSIDEQIIPFKGRSYLKQYKNKPHKWGFKVFTRAGASRMMYDFEIYNEKQMKLEGDLGISGNIVLRLTKNLADHKDYKMYFDNWFASVQLVEMLKERGIWAVGTIRKDRMAGCQLKSDKEMKKDGRGSYDNKSNDKGVTIVKWYDSKQIHIVSSHYGPEPLGICKRYCGKAKKKIDVVRPYVVQEYNAHMGGVDLADMLIELYHINLRSKKWYKRIVLYCLNAALVNGWLLYRRHAKQHKKNQKSLLTLREFRAQIASSMTIKGKEVQTKRGRPSNSLSQPTQNKKKSIYTKPNQLCTI